MTAQDRTGVLVLGAGVAGLAAALELERAGREVQVVDAGTQVGGAMRTQSLRGYRIERGANTFQWKPAMVDFLSAVGLDTLPLAAEPESRVRYFVREGKLVPVPGSLAGFARSSLLSSAGKKRLLAEPWVGKGDGSRETVAEFVERRLGPEAVSALVGPFLTGVYAGDEHQLGAAAVFPSLVELERRHGGLVRGALGNAIRSRFGAARRATKSRPGTWSAPEGLGQLSDALAERLSRPVRLGARAVALYREGPGWVTEFDGDAGPSRVHSEGVVLAVPAFAAAELLVAVDEDVSQALGGIRYEPIVAVGMGIPSTGVRQRIEGFGFLVPREERLDLLGCLFMSRLFPGRAPQGHELLHCMLGGTRWRDVFDYPEDLLRKRLWADLDRTLGLRCEPDTLSVQRWERAVPQPGVDHIQRIADVRRRLGAQPGIVLAGGYLDGVAVADALASGVTAARTIAATASTQAG